MRADQDNLATHVLGALSVNWLFIMCIKKGIKMNCIKKIAYVCVLFLMTTGAAWGMDIFQASETGNIKRIEEFLANGADVNQQDIFGDTPLHGAARNDHVDAIRMLIKSDADIHSQNIVGMTALHCAAMNGRTDAIRMLIELGARVNQQDHRGRPALYWAAKGGHENAISVLIEAGADINERIVWDAAIFCKEYIVVFLDDYNQRIDQARQRVPVIADILAQATHHRLGADSPLALLPQELMRHITHLVAEAEEVDARRPRQAVQR